MSSSETRSEPYQCRVLLFDATRPIVPHPPPWLWQMSRLPFVLSLVGRIPYARGTARAACHLAKLLCHHWHRCGAASGLDVRGDHLDRGGAGRRLVRQVRHSTHPTSCILALRF